MSNRQQRRAAQKHKGKRTGESYADVLARQKMIQEAVNQSVQDHNVTIEADITAPRLMWMSLVALNRAYGFAGIRSRRYLVTLEEVAEEVEKLAKEHGAVYAIAKLKEEAEKITESEMVPIHEEEMRQARIENQKKGVYFPEDDPDNW